MTICALVKFPMPVSEKSLSSETILTFPGRYFYDPIPVKPNIRTMNKPYYNDQAHIAQEFQFVDEHTAQTARLAFFKINSYKLSLIKASFNISREELSGIIQNTLLNYTTPSMVLSDLGFFTAEIDN